MAAPSLSLNVLDGGLGSAATDTDSLALVTGNSSAGTAGVLAFYSSPQSLIADYGYGPGVSLAVRVMQVSGKGVIFAKANDDAVGVAGSVTHNGTGTSVVTTSGNPFDAFDFLITVVAGGTIGTDVCRVSVSLDNGVTSLGTFQLPGSSLAIAKTGITLAFGAGTLVAGDTYDFACVAPLSSSTSSSTAGSIVNVIQAIPAYSSTHAGTYPTMIFDANVRDQNACALLEVELDALAAGNQFARLFTSAEASSNYPTISNWAAQISQDFAGNDTIRVSVGAGEASTYDSTVGAYLTRSTVWAVGPLLTSIKVHIDPAWVSLGSLPGVRAVTYDQRIDVDLDSARFSTLKSFVGLSGFYITNCRLMAPASSDYQFVQYGRVMDKVCRNTYGYFLQALSQSVRLNPSTGRILEAEAQALESGNNARLKANVIADGNCSSAATTVSRTDNLATPGATFHAQVAVVPLGYLKQINVDLFFVNPAA